MWGSKSQKIKQKISLSLENLYKTKCWCLETRVMPVTGSQCVALSSKDTETFKTEWFLGAWRTLQHLQCSSSQACLWILRGTVTSLIKFIFSWPQLGSQSGCWLRPDYADKEKNILEPKREKLDTSRVWGLNLLKGLGVHGLEVAVFNF